jgi:hypothetical protein
MADGTSFQIDVGVQAAGVDSAAASLATLTDRLAGAGSAAQAASDAVRAGEAAYNQAEAAANRAALAVERIGIQADAQRGKMAAALDAGDTSSYDRASAAVDTLMSRQAEAIGRSDAAKAALDGQAQSLDNLRAAAAVAADAEQQVATAMQATKEASAQAAQAQKSAAQEAAKTMAAAKEATSQAADAQQAAEGTGSARGIASGLGALGGPLGDIGQKVFQFKEGFDKLGKTLGDAGPEVGAAVAIVAVLAAVVAVTAAIAVAIVKAAAWAVGLADVARSNELLAQGVAHSVAGGEKLDKQITSLTSKVPQTREELMSMAEQLSKTGLRGDALSAALDKAATKAATLKFGPDFGREMLSVDNQSKRLQDNISQIFGGLKIEPLLKAGSTLVALFDSGSASGKAIKVVFESIFQPLIDGATGFVPKVVAAFLQFEIYVLKAAISIKPYVSWLKIAAEVVVALAAAILLGLVVAAGIVIVILAGVALQFGLMVAWTLALGAGFVWLGFQIKNGAVAAFEWLSGKVNAVIAFLSGINLVSIGTNLIQGLANGIKAGAGAVVDSITGAVGDAITSAKSLLGIASPSKVFAQIGSFTAEGMSQGIESSSDGVQNSMESMVQPPASPLEGLGAASNGKPSPPAVGGASAGGSGANFSGAIFNFYGVEGAEDAEGRFQEMLMRAVEGDATQLGAAQAPAAT